MENTDIYIPKDDIISDCKMNKSKLYWILKPGEGVVSIPVGHIPANNFEIEFKMSSSEVGKVAFMLRNDGLPTGLALPYCDILIPKSMFKYSYKIKLDDSIKIEELRIMVIRMRKMELVKLHMIKIKYDDLLD